MAATGTTPIISAAVAPQAFTADCAVTPGTRIVITKPDDFHHHFRDGSVIATVAEHASRRFARCLVMPNLKPPVTTTEMALEELHRKKYGRRMLLELYMPRNIILREQRPTVIWALRT